VKYLILLLSSLSLQAKLADWSETEQDLFKDFIALNLIDAHLTYKTINDYPSSFEMNPIIGKEPSYETLLITKAISTYIFYKALDSNNIDREKSLRITGVVYMGIVLNNGYVNFELRKKF